MKTKLINFRSFFTFISLIALFSFQNVQSQCASGYSQAYINWDVQYTNGAFTLGATGTRFAIGVNDVLFTSTGTVASLGQNGTHTGNAGISINGASDPTANYDADFNVRGGTITLTFTTEVKNLTFTIKDIDATAALNVTATDASSTAQNINLTALGSTTLTLTGNNTTNATATGASGGTASSSNNASVTVLISNSVKTVILTFTKTSTGSDPVWLSDLSACVLGAHALNYQVIGTPESGQPEYFLFASSNSLNVVNSTTGAATLLYTDPTLPDGGSPWTANGINSLAYDPYNQIVYYTSQSIIGTNHTIYKYDVKTDTKSTWISDVTVAPFNMVLPANGGLGSGAATFYNGAFYLGIEATLNNEEAGLYRFDIDAAGNAISASRVFIFNGFTTAQTLGYGDFVANDTLMYISDNGGAGALRIFNLDKQTQTNSFAGYDGQLSISSNGTPRYINATEQFAPYTGSGNWGAATQITGAIGNITNDASEVFKFPSDYGDAPSTYGTVYHQYAKPASLFIKLGTTIDYEVSMYNSTLANLDDVTNTGAANDEDGVSSFSALTTGTSSYSVTVSVANTSGSAISLYGWIDFNGNGVFDAGERAGVSGNVANNATSVTLTWSGLSGIVSGQSYVRLRIGSVNSEVNVATGKATNGEVEDYPITIINLTISGTVFDDANGVINNLIDGVGTGTPSSIQLYANLVNTSTNNVVGSVAVAANGTYILSAANGVLVNTNFTVVLSTTQGTISSPVTAAIPAGWVNTAEGNIGAGDGTINGRTAANITTSALSDLNFGIELLPTGNNGLGISQVNPGGTNTVSVTSTLFTGTDIDGTLDSIRIISFPTNTTSIVINGFTYTSANWPIQGVGVKVGTNGNITPAISLDPTDGSVSAVISFQYKDNAGKFSTATNTVSIPFTDVTITGTVFDDGSGVTNSLIDGTGKGLPSSTQVYANLVNTSTGLVVGKVAVASNGSYTLGTANGIQKSTSFNIVLSTSSGTIGQAVTAALPSGWVNTAEGTTGTGDGTINGIIATTFSATPASVGGLNFGIDSVSVAYAKTFSGLDSTTFNIPTGNATYPYRVAFSNASGTSNTSVNSSLNSIKPGKLSGSDSEDGLYSGLSGTNKRRTLVLPNSGLPNSAYEELAYNSGGTYILLKPSPLVTDPSWTFWDAANSRYLIPNFNDTALSMFIKKVVGNTSANFTYAWKDSAGVVGTSATYSITSPSPLPVTLISFEASMVDGQVHLSWQTASEMNSDRFEVERSIDGIHFHSILSQPAAGRSISILKYTDIDREIDESNASVLYYRLVNYDKDESYTKSGIRTVKISASKKAENLKAWPVPFLSELNISLVNTNIEIARLTIINANGKEVFAQDLPLQKGENYLKLDGLNDLQAGSYILTVVKNNGILHIPLIKLMH